jgi:hypothetical protein
MIGGAFRLEEINVLGMLEDHESRLGKLEANWVKIDDVEKKVLSVENTILKQGGEQKDLLHKLIDHHFNTELKKEENKATAQIKKEDHAYDLTKSKIQTKASIVTAVFSSGGVIFLIVNWLLTR